MAKNNENLIILFNSFFRFVAEKTTLYSNIETPPIPPLIRFKCRHECEKYFKTKPSRQQHEKRYHGIRSTDSDDLDRKPNEDHVLNYAKCNLRLGLLQMAIDDAIREGDGGRLLCYYSIALLYYKLFNRTKYAFTVLKLLLRVSVFEPHNATTLTWNRFINTQGKEGRNISQDLHMEHLNGYLKNLLDNLGPNLNEQNAARVANSLQRVKQVNMNIEEALGIKKCSENHTYNEDIAGVQLLANELKNAQIFKNLGLRQHYSFPQFEKSLLAKLDQNTYAEWITKKTEEFQKIYGNIEL